MKINDLAKVRSELLKECPSCDMGLPYSCVCPPVELDWRPIVFDLVTEIEELRKAWHSTGEQLHLTAEELKRVNAEYRAAVAERLELVSSLAELRAKLAESEYREYVEAYTRALSEGES